MGRYSAEALYAAYRRGYYPMSDGGHLALYSSDPRAILELSEFHCPRRLARELRSRPFEIRITTQPEAVIRGCAARTPTWISEELIELYRELIAAGHLQSVEAYREGRLAGGLYGITAGGAFFGESMFRVVDGASKACVVALVGRLRERGYRLLDCQQLTDNMRRYGARLVPMSEYLERLQAALGLECHFGD